MRKHHLVSTAFCLLLLLNLGLFIAWQKSYRSQKFNSSIPLLSGRVSASNTNDILVNFVDLRESVRTYFEKLGLKHSFYFEYLPSGVNVRDGQDNELAAASLMKLPLVMDLYRTAEENRINLDQELTIRQSEISNDSDFGNTTDLKVGQKLTLRQASKITLTKSDNTAARFISEEVTPLIRSGDKALDYLDLPITRQATDQGEYVTISAKNYGSILSCLYLSCLLQPSSSQELLSYLVESENRSRIPSGVPDGVKVANKLGTFSDQSQSDCGIVYEPKRPYLICMMVFASNNIDNVFRDVSRMVYNYVHTAHVPKK